MNVLVDTDFKLARETRSSSRRFLHLNLHHLRLRRLRAERKHIHRADGNANATTNAAARIVVEHLLLDGVTHHVDTDLAISRTLGAANAFVVGDDMKAAHLELAVELTHGVHHFGQRTPVAAPNLAAHKRVKRNGNDAHQPNVRDQMVDVEPDGRGGLENRHDIAQQHHHGNDAGSTKHGPIHPFPGARGRALRGEVPPAIAQGLGQPAATTNPRTIALAMKQDQDGNNHKGQKNPPNDPNLVRVVEERVEEQWPGINNPVGAPSLLAKRGIAGQTFPDPLVLDRPFEKKFRNKKEEDPLERKQADVAPDLKLVLAVDPPAFERLQTEISHQQRVEHRVPK